MDIVPLHPKLVHLPIALAVLMPLLSSGLLLAWWRGWLPRRAWILAASLQVLLALSGLAALRSGAADEERVERVVDERAIEAHEEAAEGFVLAAAAVAALALGVPFVHRERAARGLAVAAVAGTLLVSGLGYRTGAAGGRLVYAHGAARAFAPPSREAGHPALEGSRPPDPDDD